MSKAISIDSHLGNLVVAGEDDVIHLYEHTTKKTKTSNLTASQPTSVVFAKLNNDNTMDIIGATKTGELFWYDETTDIKYPIDDLSKPIVYAFGIDVDGDGNTDIVTSTNDSQSKIVWFQNDGTDTPSFTKQTIEENNGNITITKATDIDNDGDIDVVAADDAGNIFIYTNDTAIKTMQIAPTAYGDFTRYDINNTVIDNNTKLIWQDNDTEEKTWLEAKIDCQNIGYGWRLPSVEELISITDNDRKEPSISDKFQFSSIDGDYWTSEVNSTDSNYAWVVNFDDGSSRNNVSIGDSYNFRCVKGSPFKTELIKDDNKKIVLDKQHNLMWQDNNISDNYFYNQAKNCCNIDLASYSDWRLPTINELNSITDKNKANPAIRDAFQNIGNVVGVVCHYLSSTELQGGNPPYKAIDFTDGSIYLGTNTENYYVRCVRDIP